MQAKDSATALYIASACGLKEVAALLLEKKASVNMQKEVGATALYIACLLYTSPSPRDGLLSRMPSSA